MRLEIGLIPSLDIRVVSSYHIGTLSFYLCCWTRLRIGLHTYVPNVRSKCFICFFRHMLQVCLSGCCICFTHMLQVFYLDVAYVCNGFQALLGVFASVFTRMLQMFQLFRTYMTSVASECCKTRSCVAYVVIGSTCRSRLL
jgi:hypothetical protein